MIRALDGVIEALGRYRGIVVDLLVGQPCFEPPAEILAAFERVAGSSAAGYGPPAGLAELRNVIAETAGGSAAVDNVVITHGAKGGLLAVMAALVDPGDEVIHPIPCYPAYPAMVRRFGGVPVGVPETEAGFGGWSTAVADAMTSRTRAVVLASPSNPSGSILEADERDVVVDRCAAEGVTLILDEAYTAFRFDGGFAEPEVGKAVVRVGSASKELALCGWRVGWVLAGEELAARIAGAQAALLNPPATPPQRALVALPEVPQGYFEANRRTVRRRLEVLAKALVEAGFDVAVPAGGFYLWIDVRDRLEGASTVAWSRSLAEDRGVGLWPGEDFGSPGWVRAALPRGGAWRDDVVRLQERLEHSFRTQAPGTVPRR
jgi:aspartate/methionine/tyrosine aminotransferase